MFGFNVLLEAFLPRCYTSILLERVWPGRGPGGEEAALKAVAP